MFPNLGNSGGPPNPNGPPVTPPVVSDSMKYSKLFGSDAHAAAEKAGKGADGKDIKTAAGAAASATALFQNMKAQPGGEQKYAENMDAIQKYLALRHGDRSVDEYVNPGTLSQTATRVGNMFGKPSDEEVLMSMMRNHNARYGTPEQKQSAANSRGKSPHNRTLMSYILGIR